MPKKDIAVLFADTHLDERAWTHRPIYGDSYYAFEQIVDYAIRRNLPLVGAGDLIDKNLNRSGPIVFLSGQLRRLEAAGLPLFFVQGQHEMADVPWLELGRSQHLHGQTHNIDGVNFYGIDYQPTGKLQEELDLVPEDTDALICHQVWDEFMGDIANPQGGMHDVSNTKILFTGDFHEHHIKTVRNKQNEKMLLVSPGSTNMRSIAEPADKYFCVLEQHDDGSLAVRVVTLHSRPFLNWDEIIRTEPQMDRFLELAGQSLEVMVEQYIDAIRDPECGVPPSRYCGLEEPLLRVEYSHLLERGAARIQAAVNKFRTPTHLFLKERPPEKTEVLQRRERRRKEGETAAQTMESSLGDFLDSKDLKHLSSDVQRLLSTQEPTAEILRMKQEALSDG